MNQEREVSGVIDRAGQRLELAFTRFVQVYQRTNPKPEYQVYGTLTKWSMLALLITAASGTALAFAASVQNELQAFFPDVPAQSLYLIALVLAAAAVMGVEGLIVTTGMQDGLDERREESIRKKRGIAAIILLVVSIAAAIFQRMHLVNEPEVQLVLGIVLAFVAGVGIPVAILLASPYLGYAMNIQRRAEERWLAKAREEFQRTPEYQLAVAEIEAERELTRMQVDAQKEELQQQAEARKLMMEREHRFQLRKMGLEQRQELEGYQNTSSNNPSLRSRRSGSDAQEQWTTPKILQWYMDAHPDLTLADDIQASRIADEWAKTFGFTAQNGELTKLQGALRTQLSRERKSQGM